MVIEQNREAWRPLIHKNLTHCTRDKANQIQEEMGNKYPINYANMTSCLHSIG